MDGYIEILKIMLKKNTNGYDNIIKNILIKIFDIYYLDRNIQKYNIDNLFKKYNINMYNLLKRKYKLTESKKLLFKKHKYDKREYIMFLLKKNDFILNENETYRLIVDEILKNDIKCYTKFIKNYCHDRILKSIIFIKMKNMIFEKIHINNYI